MDGHVARMGKYEQNFRRKTSKEETTWETEM